MGFKQLLHHRIHAFSKSQQQSTEAVAWPGIGGERHTDVPRGESDRMSDRAEEPIPGRAAAAYRSQQLTGGAQHRMRYGCSNNIGQPYPHPNPSPDGRGASGNFVVTAFMPFRSHSNNVPRRQRGRGLAESGTRMCRAASQTGCLTEPRSQSPAALPPLTEAGDSQARAWSYPEKPYPHPNPRSAPRPALAARALQGTRAHAAQAVPSRPGGRGALSQQEMGLQPQTTTFWRFNQARLSSPPRLGRYRMHGQT